MDYGKENKIDMNIEYEKALQDIGIPLVDLTGVNPSFCEAINIAVKKMFQLYPLLSKTLCGIGIFESIMNYALEYNFLDSTDYLLANEENKTMLELKNNLNEKETFGYYNDFLSQDLWYHNNRANMFSYKGKSHMSERNAFTAIILTTHIYKENNQYTPTEIYHKIWHELGHHFDFFIKISEKEEFSQIIKKYNLVELMHPWFTETPSETFAELFSIIHSTPDRELAILNEIEDLIAREYVSFCKKNKNYENGKLDLTSQFIVDNRKR